MTTKQIAEWYMSPEFPQATMRRQLAKDYLELVELLKTIYKFAPLGKIEIVLTRQGWLEADGKGDAK